MLIPIPETARSVLIETSFADAIEIISNSAELPELKRRHWSTSLRQVGKLLGKPLALIPARYSGVRADLRNLHHVPAEMSEKTLQNHKSNAKTALLWLAGEKGIPEHGAPLAPAWVALQAEVNDALLRMRLSPLLRFASANGIAPDELDEAVMDRFMAYRRTTGQKAGDNVRRLIARAWNAAGETMQAWPKRELAVPAPKQKVEVPWERAFRRGCARRSRHTSRPSCVSEKDAQGSASRRQSRQPLLPAGGSCRPRRAWR
jgi:hypothetical protein